MTYDDDGRQVMAIAHMALWARWAKKMWSSQHNSGLCWNRPWPQNCSPKSEKNTRYIGGEVAAQNFPKFGEILTVFQSATAILWIVVSCKKKIFSLMFIWFFKIYWWFFWFGLVSFLLYLVSFLLCLVSFLLVLFRFVSVLVLHSLFWKAPKLNTPKLNIHILTENRQNILTPKYPNLRYLTIFMHLRSGLLRGVPFTEIGL